MFLKAADLRPIVAASPGDGLTTMGRRTGGTHLGMGSGRGTVAQVGTMRALRGNAHEACGQSRVPTLRHRKSSNGDAGIGKVTFARSGSVVLVHFLVTVLLKIAPRRLRQHL